jgi:hypothetical protein
VNPAEQERARTPTGPAFADAVTFAFGDAAAGVYGLARLGLSGEGASALAVLFSGREPVAAVARGGLEVEGEPWQSLSAGGLRTTVDEPLARWTVALDGAEHGFELTFEALSPAAGVSEDFVGAGGMAGYEQVCLVTGHATVGGRRVDVRCLGQRGHSWGEPDWERLSAARTVSAWIQDGPALALQSVRPDGAVHADEPVWAALLGPGGAAEIDDPRVSTTYDGDGRQRRAGLELWVDEEDEFPARGSGEVLCGSTLELGSLRLDCAFFRWRLEGREGVGRYDVLRRA